jgi:cytochrome c oxidase subunit 2
MIDTRTQFGHLHSIYWPMGVGVFALFAGMFVFAVLRYRDRGAGRRPSRARDSPKLEGTYAVLLIGVAAFLVTQTFRVEHRVDATPSEHAGLTVNATASRWLWRFDYPSLGISETGRLSRPTVLVVPTGTPVRFNLTSLDVIHEFWVPGERFGREAFANSNTPFDLVFGRTGTFPGECRMYCGLRHTEMLFTVRALAPSDFQAWAVSQRRR